MKTETFSYFIKYTKLLRFHSFNPNKRGIPASTRRGAVVCFPPTTRPRTVVGRKHTTAPLLVLFLYKTVPPPLSPGRARSNCQLYVFLQCPFFGTARYYIIAVPKKGHVGGKKPLQRPGFIFGISPFSHQK